MTSPRSPAAGALEERSLRATFDGTPAAFERMETLLALFAAEKGLPPSALYDFNVVLDEAVSNIVKYAYATDARTEIAIELAWRGGVVEMAIEDGGIPFDPLQVPPLASGGAASDRRVGGLGVHLMRGLMDEAEYSRVHDHNRLVVRKRITTTRGGEDDVEITASDVDGVVVLEVNGRVNSQTAPALGERLTTALAGSEPRVALDVTAVDYLSSAGLRVLQIALGQARANRGKLVLYGLNTRVQDVFQISGFNTILTVCATRAEALAAASS
jgi:anti-anti-sigma factor